MNKSTSVLLSLSQAEEGFGRSRKSIGRKIRELGIKPASSRNGHPVYALKDLVEIERKVRDGAIDPDKLTPFERQAHYKAESERLKVDLERGQLIRREDAHEEWARVLRAIALELDTIVDEIERDAGAGPLILEKIEQKLDVIRERMYQRVIAGDGEQEQSGASAEARELEHCAPPAVPSEAK